MRESFKTTLNQPLIYLYLAAASIGNTSFFLSVFSIFMLFGLAWFTGLLVGIVAAIGLLALHHVISKELVNTRFSVAVSWLGVILIFSLSVVGWFFILHHVTFGVQDIQERNQSFIQAEYDKLNDANNAFIDSLATVYKDQYEQAVLQRSPKTAAKADTAIQGLISRKQNMGNQTVRDKIFYWQQASSGENVLLSYISRKRQSLSDMWAEILIWILALLVNAGIDFSGFAFNRVSKDVVNVVVQSESNTDSEQFKPEQNQDEFSEIDKQVQSVHKNGQPSTSLIFDKREVNGEQLSDEFEQLDDQEKEQSDTVQGEQFNNGQKLTDEQQKVYAAILEQLNDENNKKRKINISKLQKDTKTGSRNTIYKRVRELKRKGYLNGEASQV